MSPERWIAKKSTLLEALLAVTFQMKKDSEDGEIEKFDSRLRERQRLFRELGECDAELDGFSTPQDQMWTNQLKQVQKLDSEISSLIKIHQGRLLKEGRNIEKTRSYLAEETRGRRIETKG